MSDLPTGVAARALAQAASELAGTPTHGDAPPRALLFAGSWEDGRSTALTLLIDGDLIEGDTAALDDLVEVLLEEQQEGLQFPLAPVRMGPEALLDLATPQERAHLDVRRREALDRPTRSAPPPVPTPATTTVYGATSVDDGAGTAEETTERADLRSVFRRVLTRMMRMRKIGEAHTDIAHFWRGVPGSVRGHIKALLDILILHGYVRLKPTLTGPHISLEPARLRELQGFVESDRVLPGPMESYILRNS